MRSDRGIYAQLTAVYDVEILTADSVTPRVERNQSRVSALYWVSVARSLPAHLTVRYSRRWTYTEHTVTLCAGCRARPSLADIDCDGWYDTGECGVCNWHAAWSLRHSTSSSI